MNLLISRISYEFFQFFFTFLKIPFFEKKKKIEAKIVQLLVQSHEKFLYMKWNHVPKTYPKFVRLRLFFKIFKKIFKTKKKN